MKQHHLAQFSQTIVANSLTNQKRLRPAIAIFSLVHLQGRLLPSLCEIVQRMPNAGVGASTSQCVGVRVNCTMYLWVTYIGATY